MGPIIGHHRDGRPIYAMGGGAPGGPTFPAKAFMAPQMFPLSPDKAFTLGGAAVNVPLRRQGYLSRVVVKLTGTYTVANAALVFVQLGAYNVVNAFRLQFPQRPAPMWSMGGYFAHIWELRQRAYSTLRQAWRFPAQGALDANAAYAAMVDQFPGGLGAQTLTLWWTLQANYAADDVRGVAPLGNLEQVNLIIQPATTGNGDVFDVAANFTVPVFTLTVEQVSLMPPLPAYISSIAQTTRNPDVNGVDTGWQVAIDENYQAVTQTGKNVVALTPEWSLLGVATLLTYATAGVNAQPDYADLTGLQIMLNAQPLYPDGQRDPSLWMHDQVYENDVPYPQGLLMWDRDVLGPVDWLASDNFTDLELWLFIAAGAVAGTNPRIYTSTRRMINLDAAGHASWLVP